MAPSGETSADDGPGLVAPVAWVVGIGSSAGGLEALQELVGGLSPTGRVAYVVAQHLAPDRPSLLAELLATRTTLRVVIATDGMVLEPDVVVVGPPQFDLMISGHVLNLADSEGGPGPSPSVDRLFGSIARSWTGRCTGVVLSGTGSDGAHGLREIKAAGGLVVVQSPESAKFDAMPRASLAMTAPDLILPASQMGPRLTELAGLPGVVAPELVVHPTALSSVISTLRRGRGMDFAGYKESTLSRQVGRRMALRGISDLADYLPVLAAEESEQVALVGNLLVTVTRFFRDPAAFAALSTRLDDYVRSRVSDDPLRIWVPGCATGEEVYTLLMLMDGLLDRPDRLADHVKVFGTDLDERSLSVARRGFYSPAAVEALEPALVDEYFVSMPDGFGVRDRLRECAVFAQHNVTTDPPFPRLDLVSFRNTCIYFTAPLQVRALESIRFGLEQDGLLFLGQAEAIPDTVFGLSPVDAAARIFRRTAYAPAGPRPESTSRWTHRTIQASGPQAGAAQSAIQAEHGRILQSVASATAGPSIVLDTDHRVVLFLGDITPYCRLAEGKPSTSVTDLLLPELVAEARALLLRARADGSPVVGQPVPVAGHARPVCLRVLPLRATDPPLTLLAFDLGPETAHGTGSDSEAPAPRTAGFEAELERLERELLRSQDTLNLSMAELETANEELQALTEELQGSGEELQASNEELETANEELSATNEELGGLNAQLRERGVALQDTLDDLENIQASVTQDIVIVDENLAVTRYSSSAVRVFALMATDIGQSLLSVPTTMPVPGLEAALRGALGGMASDDLEFTRDDASYLARAKPYQGLRGGHRGAVLTLTDITDRVAVERRAATLSAMFESVFRNPTFGTALIDDVGKVLLASDKLGQIFGLDPDSMTGLPVALLTAKTAPPAGGTAASSGESILESELERVVRPDGEFRWVRTSFSSLAEPAGGAVAVLIAEDATVVQERAVHLSGQAFHDALTGLANRAAIHELAEKAVAGARRTGARLALAWIDLDSFKDVNDKDGHAVGDAVLCAIAERIGGVVRENDEVGRLGGDEFAVLFHDIGNLSEVDAVIERLLATLRLPLTTEGSGAIVSASVGVAVFPDDGSTVDELLRAADSAMYAAKKLGGDCFAFFQPSMNLAADARREMRATVAAALHDGAFELHYQPIVSCVDGAVWGAESLLRMNRDGVVVAASEFIGFCEDSGQIRALGPLTLKLLRQGVAALGTAGRDDLRLCLNLSVSQLEDRKFAEEIARSGLSGLHNFVVEVTESIFLPDNARAMGQLNLMRALGAKFSVDDFGTGFSNLGLLLDIAPDFIKLDRTFLRRPEDRGAQLLIGAAVEMAHAVGALVVAEGVESQNARDLVTRLGVDLIQGYAIAHPMPLHDLVAWIDHASTSATGDAG